MKNGEEIVMAVINNDLTIIQIAFEGKCYTIRAEEIKTEDKQSVEKYESCDSHDPYAISFGKCEYSIDLSGVAPEHKKFFMWIRNKQRTGKFPKGLPLIQTIEYENGFTVQMEQYRNVYITDISRTKNEPFDVKMEALNRTYINAKGEFV